MLRKSAKDIRSLKGNTPIVCLTAYTAPIARAIDEKVDLMLVGDSLGMVLYDYENTLQVTLEQMINHAKSVVNASSKSCVIVDMPFGTYEESADKAFMNSARVMKETNCNGVKLEGGQKISNTIKYLTQSSIPVMGHIGLQPQSVLLDGGYKVKGKVKSEWQKFIDDAIAVQEAGAFSVVLEGMAEPLAAEITSTLKIPTIGIGASPKCDGQILVTEDMLGLTNVAPKFVKKYIDLEKNIKNAVDQYSFEVKNRSFPTSDHIYHMKPEIVNNKRKIK
ncbi:MAG: 3-methyl-2-oxobutanoate hydroxymethyltransferase [Flavobacteriales bacterium]|nr:3-methyl-2-oxobutanoate hydroxymethyltransferase [Flavobacteriales bacterium]|tara:strand:- start:42 stop:872 length:831 start_codon:yes stop_codon:yes gene_type:complete